MFALAIAAALATQPAAAPRPPVGYDVGAVELTAPMAEEPARIGERVVAAAAACITRDLSSSSSFATLALAAPASGGQAIEAAVFRKPMLPAPTDDEVACIVGAMKAISLPGARDAALNPGGAVGVAVLVAFGRSSHFVHEETEQRATHLAALDIAAAGRRSAAAAEKERVAAAAIAEQEQARVAARKAAAVDYDRFKDVTSVTAVFDLAPTSASRQLSQLLGTFSGTKPTKTDAVMILAFAFPDWRYLKCNDVAMLIDGKPAPLGVSTHDGDVATGGVVEHIIVPVPLATRLRMAKASKIEVRVCRDEMTVVDGLASIADASARLGSR
jgi:hypothetical protein